MAYNEKIRIDIDSGGSGQRTAKDIGKATKAIKSAGPSARDATYLIQNFGEGLGDLQYGARNVANNVEIMLGSWGRIVQREGSVAKAFKSIASGLMGPAGVISAIILLVNYGPEIYQFFKDFADGTNSTAREADELNDRLREQYGLLQQIGAISPKDQEEALKQIKKLNKEIKSVQGRIKLGEGNPLVNTEDLEKELADLIQKRTDLLLTLSEIEFEDYEKKEKKKTEVANREALRRHQYEISLGAAYTHGHLAGIDPSIIGTGNKGGGGNTLPGTVNPTTGSLFNADFLNNSDFEQWRAEQKEGLNDLTNDWLTAEQGVLAFASAINGMSTGGFEGMAKNLIDTARNIAMAMAITAATKDGVKFGAVAIPALIAGALGAVSSAFGKVKGGGASSTATGRQVIYNVAAGAPTLSQGGTVGDRYVGELELRGDTLVVGLQAANETRSRY